MVNEFHGSDVARARVVHWFNFHKNKGVDDIKLSQTFITWYSANVLGWTAVVETEMEDGLVYFVQYQNETDQTLLRVYFEQFTMVIESNKPDAPIQDKLPFDAA